MAFEIQISTLSVPTSFCPSNIRTDWPYLVGLLRASLAETFTGLLIGASQPAPEDQDKGWIKLDASGYPERLYNFVNGAWICRHGLPPGFVSMWAGSEASLKTWDGGEDLPSVTLTTGPMWEVVTEVAGRVILAPGTLPVSGVTVGVGETGGADKEALNLQVAQIPPHTHQIGVESTGETGDAESGRLRVTDGSISWQPTVTSNKIGYTRETGEGEAIQLSRMPPYYGMYIIRRTAREFYRAT